MTHRVFVYGTLKRGIQNHHLLRGAEYVGNAYTIECFTMFNVGFPVIRTSESEEARSVFGEVYDVDDTILARLDRLENNGVMYDRKTVQIAFPPGQGMASGGQDLIDEAGIYIGNPKYWDQCSPQPYTNTNDFGELEWHP
jgi:gamma-glutamylcyclotransferase (GGCT)/AIG2-like uncharacterized protein YtfP